MFPNLWIHVGNNIMAENSNKQTWIWLNPEFTRNPFKTLVKKNKIGRYISKFYVTEREHTLPNTRLSANIRKSNPTKSCVERKTWKLLPDCQITSSNSTTVQTVCVECWLIWDHTLTHTDDDAEQQWRDEWNNSFLHSVLTTQLFESSPLQAH